MERECNCPYCGELITRGEYISLDLPFPPSANEYWRFVQGYAHPLLSAEARTYSRHVGNVVFASGVKRPLKGRLGVTMLLHAPDARRRDLDNYLQGPFDALTKSGLWEDDSQVDKLVVIRESVDVSKPRISTIIEHVKINTVF